MTSTIRLFLNDIRAIQSAFWNLLRFSPSAVISVQATIWDESDDLATPTCLFSWTCAIELERSSENYEQAVFVSFCMTYLITFIQWYFSYSLVNIWCSQRWQTSLSVQPPGDLDQTSDVRLVLPPGKLDETYMTYFILAYSMHYMKTWRHPQNRKFILYRNAVRAGPSHGHG